MNNRNNRQTRLVICLSLFVLLHFVSAVQTHEGNEFTGIVVEVIDGDTIKVMHEGKVAKIRLAGIDCPEKKQPFGKKAKQFTSHLALDQEVKIKGRKKNKHGLIIADVILFDNRNLNQELVNAGLAWWYRSFTPYNILLKSLGTGARIAKRGLWADKNPIPPWKWRQGER